MESGQGNMSKISQAARLMRRHARPSKPSKATCLLRALLGARKSLKKSRGGDHAKIDARIEAARRAILRERLAKIEAEREEIRETLARTPPADLRGIAPARSRGR